MFRVINYDMNDEVWGSDFTTIEEAKKFQKVNYFFMTGVQQLIEGKWVNVKGSFEEVFEELAGI